MSSQPPPEEENQNNDSRSSDHPPPLPVPPPPLQHHHHRLLPVPPQQQLPMNGGNVIVLADDIVDQEAASTTTTDAQLEFILGQVVRESLAITSRVLMQYQDGENVLPLLTGDGRRRHDNDDDDASSLPSMPSLPSSSSSSPSPPHVKCPICQVSHAYEPAAAAAGSTTTPSTFTGDLSTQYSHNARVLHQAATCPVCLERVEPPIVVLACGHVICPEHFQCLHGKIGPDALLSVAETLNREREREQQQAQASSARLRLRQGAREWLRLRQGAREWRRLPGLDDDDDYSYSIYSDDGDDALDHSSFWPSDEDYSVDDADDRSIFWPSDDDDAGALLREWSELQLSSGAAEPNIIPQHNADDDHADRRHFPHLEQAEEQDHE